MKKRIIMFLPIIIFVIAITILGSISLFSISKINKYLATDLNGIPANISFQDQNFYNCVVDSYNIKNKTNVAYTESLTDEQLQTITHLTCRKKNISDVSGLEKLTSITYLDLSYNQLSSINLSHNSNLTSLSLNDNQLSSIDLSQNSNLTSLSLNDNQLTSIDLSQNSNLKSLSLNNNQLSSIDLSQNLNLTNLSLYRNQLVSIDLSKNSNLTTLSLNNNQLSSIDLSQNSNLTNISMDNNQLTSIDLSQNSNLTNISMDNNQLTSIDLSQNSNLTNLSLYKNQLTSIDLSQNTNLITLSLNNNQLTSIDLSHTPNLTNLYLSNNQIPSINLSKTQYLTYLDLSNNNLNSIDLSHTPNIEYLVLSNNQLSNIDLSHTPNIENIFLNENQFTSIDLRYTPNLDYINLSGNQFTSIDLRYTPNLRVLNMENNQLTSLDLSHTPNIMHLQVSSNQLTNIDVRDLQDLEILTIRNNLLTDIDLSQNTNLSDDSLSLDLKYNPFSINKYVYVGKEESIDSPVKLPPQISWSNPTYTSKDNTIATINNNKIHGLKKGNVDITGTVDDKYKYTIHAMIFDLESDKYIVNSNNIYIGPNNINDIANNITTEENITKEIDSDNNKLILKYNDEVIQEFDILRIDLGHFSVGGKKIGLANEEVSYSSFTNEITPIGVTYKIFNNEQEITSGNIEAGMILKVYIDNEEVDSYEFSKYFIDISQFEVKNENIIYNLSLDTTVKDIKNKLYTNGNIKLYKDSNELSDTDKVTTGTTVRIQIPNKIFEYKISIRGDASGDGKINYMDYVGIYNHIQKEKHPTSDKKLLTNEKFIAGDINDDNKITYLDYVKLYGIIKNK